MQASVTLDLGGNALNQCIYEALSPFFAPLNSVVYFRRTFTFLPFFLLAVCTFLYTCICNQICKKGSSTHIHIVTSWLLIMTLKERTKVFHFWIALSGVMITKVFLECQENLCLLSHCSTPESAIQPSFLVKLLK